MFSTQNLGLFVLGRENGQSGLTSRRPSPSRGVSFLAKSYKEVTAGFLPDAGANGTPPGRRGQRYRPARPADDPALSFHCRVFRRAGRQPRRSRSRHSPSAAGSALPSFAANTAGGGIDGGTGHRPRLSCCWKLKVACRLIGQVRGCVKLFRFAWIRSIKSPIVEKNRSS